MSASDSTFCFNWACTTPNRRWRKIYGNSLLVPFLKDLRVLKALPHINVWHQEEPSGTKWIFLQHTTPLTRTMVIWKSKNLKHPTAIKVKVILVMREKDPVWIVICYLESKDHGISRSVYFYSVLMPIIYLVIAQSIQSSSKSVPTFHHFTNLIY